jgi:hypothetical protein
MAVHEPGLGGQMVAAARRTGPGSSVLQGAGTERGLYFMFIGIGTIVVIVIIVLVVLALRR